MGRKKKDTFETFYFTVDDWARKYRFGINRHRWEFAPLQERDGNQLNVASSWIVAGSVGHWGHVHQRTNAYSANLEISEIDGVWKLTRLEILDERRL